MLDIKKAIRDKALEVGFDVVGFTSGAADERLQGDLGQYLEQGRHGQMAWMAENTDRRTSPKGLWPDVRSVIVLGLNYAPAWSPSLALGRADRGNISVYAQGKDWAQAAGELDAAQGGAVATSNGHGSEAAEAEVEHPTRCLSALS